MVVEGGESEGWGLRAQGWKVGGGGGGGQYPAQSSEVKMKFKGMV